MEKIKFEQGIELERTEEGEYVLRFRLPTLKITPEPMGGHLKQSRREVLLAVRNLIDRVIGDTEGKGEK